MEQPAARRRSMPEAATMAKQTKTKPVFDVAKLRKAAGNKVFERGEDYHADGSVDILTFSNSRVTAQVTGTQPYFVDLACNNGELSGSCSCPAYVDHGFCKHMVATGLTANDHVPDDGAGADTIENVLRSLDHEALVKLVIDIVSSDPKALHALSLKTALISLADSDAPSLAKKLKREIKAATRVGEFVGYDEVPAWAARIEELIDSIEGLLAKGHGALVMELADLLREQLNDAFEAIDDSDGQMGMLVSRAMQLHLAACRLACPDPVQLAKDLFAREMADDFGLEDTIETYADLLGDSGRQEMERLAAAAWAKLRPPRAGVDDDDGAWSTHSQLATMLDRFAADRGDLQARIDIRKRDLSHPGRYLDLAKLCEEHSRTDEAIKWVEDGLFIFEDNRDDRLVLYAADLFLRHGRADDRSALLWRAFSRGPSIDLHKKLVHNLKGGNRVEATDRAIELIKTRKPNAGRLRLQNDDDLVVSILSSERRLDEAWTFAASAKCTVYCLEELAQASEKSHPRQALEVHQRRVTRLVQTGGNQCYEEAHRLIKRMRIIAEQGGEADGQAAFESDLLAKHHAKRNFIKLMSDDTATHRIRR
jgi:uncharacterized Zn finger protein